MRAVRTYEPVNCGEDFLPFVPFRLVKYAEPIRPRLEASVRLVIPDGSRDRPREEPKRAFILFSQNVPPQPGPRESVKK